MWHALITLFLPSFCRFTSKSGERKGHITLTVIHWKTSSPMFTHTERFGLSCLRCFTLHFA